MKQVPRLPIARASPVTPPADTDPVHLKIRRFRYSLGLHGIASPLPDESSTGLTARNIATDPVATNRDSQVFSDEP